MLNVMPRSRAGLLACATLLCLPGSHANLDSRAPISEVLCEKDDSSEVWTCKANADSDKALLLVNGKRQYESSSLADCKELLRLKLEVPGCTEASSTGSDDAQSELGQAGNSTEPGPSAESDDDSDYDDKDSEDAAGASKLDSEEPSKAALTQQGAPEVAVEASAAGSSVAWLALLGTSGLVFVFGAWQAVRWLTSPKKTPAPLLADTELGEGDPVNSSEGPGTLWMASGNRQARQFVSQQPSAGFTQF